jgi:thioredoxin 1
MTMASAKVKHLTDADFESVIQGGQPVLVDFWAEWCGPCRRIGPIVEELAEEYDGKLTVAKINIDEHQAAANQLGVQSIPTLMLFKGGQLAERIVGAVPKDTLVEAINRVV